jgi:signal transduction histidine kinase
VTVEPMMLAPFLAWLASGMAAVALTPRNGAARALCASGVVIAAAWLVEGVALDQSPDRAASALVNLGADGLFLLKTPAIVAVLLLLPNGVFSRPWHRVVVLGMLLIALLVPFLRLLGSVDVTVGNAPETAVNNPFAVASLAPLGALGDALLVTEPLWFLLGVAVLVSRWFAEPHLRQELTRVLLGIGVLAALLVLVVVGELTQLPHLVPQPLFLVALAVFPGMLLLEISRRSRRLQHELAESRARLVAAEDRARRELERDLHDGVQQQLVGILTLTELASRQAGRQPARVGSTLDEVRSEVETAITGLRELVRGIRPPALADGGVVAALSDRFDRLARTVELDHALVAGRRWPPEVEAAAYFVACEGVTNAVKHAPGAAIHVRLTAPEGLLRVDVTDSGPGIGERPAGSGLRGLQDRVESLGGRFEVTSSRTGTTVTAELPQGHA